MGSSMAPAVVGLISAFLTIVRYVTEYCVAKKWIDVGTAEIILKNLQESDDAIARAQKARELVRSNSTRDPASILRDDDGFRRDE